MEQKKAFRLPVPGQRILRSMVAIWLCFAVYLLRGGRGIPFYAAIAALQCMQPYTRSMGESARKRLLGTAVGAFWGLVSLLLELNLTGRTAPDDRVHILLIGLFAGVVLYFTVLLKITEVSYFATVVMLSITVNHIGDENPYLFVLNRVLDTFIGVVVAELVNRARLPRSCKTDTLYAAEFCDAPAGGGGELSPHAVVELNRMIQDGARFTVTTIQAPATVRERLGALELREPIIALDGAILYDLNSLRYLRTVQLSREQARLVTEFLEQEGLPFFTNTVEDDLLVVRIGELGNEAIRDLYERKRLAPYRNFARRRAQEWDNVVYFLALDRRETLERAAEKLRSQPWSAGLRLEWDAEKELDGWAGLKISSAEASREKMLEELRQMLALKEAVSFGREPGRFDVVIPDGSRDRLVRELKRRFEPVDLRCWRSVFKR